MTEIKFNKKTQILELKLSGEITLKEVLKYIISIKENKTYPRLLKLKNDSKNADFKISIDDLEVIVMERNQMLEEYVFLIEAMIVGKPHEAALSILYKLKDNHDKYQLNVFSTDKGASNWLECW